MEEIAIKLRRELIYNQAFLRGLLKEEKLSEAAIAAIKFRMERNKSVLGPDFKPEKPM